MAERAEWIRHDGYDALKFAGAAVWWFYTRWESFRATPKMPIGAVWGPHFGDFVNPKEAPAAKTHHFLGMIRQIRKASITADFSGGLNLILDKRLRGSGNGEFSSAKRFFGPPPHTHTHTWPKIGKQKGGNAG